jgi:hypothetical protein
MIKDVDGLLGYVQRLLVDLAGWYKVVMGSSILTKSKV